MWQTLQLLFPKLLFPPPPTPPQKKMDEFNIKLSQYSINKIFELTKSCIWSISANSVYITTRVNRVMLN